jgi:hypothetical protein
MHPRYNRALAGSVIKVLEKNAPLRFLLDEVPDPSDEPASLDVQIREFNKLMYYHGTTRLLTLQFKVLNTGQVEVTATADKKGYSKFLGYQELMRPWRQSEAVSLRGAFRRYLDNAVQMADDRYYGNHKEGYWQNKLCHRFGKLWELGDDWLIIDRECVIGFDDDDEKKEFYEKSMSAFLNVKHRLQGEEGGAKIWGQLKDKTLGDELDLLAINKQGRLTIIELKHGTNSSGIYWGPLQVGLYQHEFSATIEAIVEDIKRLVRQKIHLGLLPSQAEGLLGNNLNQIESVLAVADCRVKSKCWNKMALVMEEMGKTGIKIPLQIAAIQQDLRIKLMKAPICGCDLI